MIYYGLLDNMFPFSYFCPNAEVEYIHWCNSTWYRHNQFFVFIAKLQTRGPWWSYIAHLTKQICIFTVEVSAKFTALGFLYKLYSTNHPHPPPPHPWPCFFTNLDDLNWILKEGHQRNISAKLYWNWSSGLKSYKALRHNGHVFWRIMTAWTNLVEGHQRNIPTKLYWNLFSSFWQEDF